MIMVQAVFDGDLKNHTGKKHRIFFVLSNADGVPCAHSRQKHPYTMWWALPNYFTAQDCQCLEDRGERLIQGIQEEVWISKSGIGQGSTVCGHPETRPSLSPGSRKRTMRWMYPDEMTHP